MMNFFQFPAGTWNLPAESSQTLTGEEDACLQLHKVQTCFLRLPTSCHLQVWWPEDRSCHALLSQVHNFIRPLF